MSPDEIKRFVDEVLHHSPGLTAHRSALESLACGIVGHGLDVATRFDEPVSSVERHTHDGGGIIRLNPTVGDDALWDLAHELGHLDEPPIKGLPPDQQLTLEEKAWQRGWEILLELEPGLITRKTKFDTRREDCLRTYRTAAGVSAE